jgi:hypothetical protein
MDLKQAIKKSGNWYCYVTSYLSDPTTIGKAMSWLRQLVTGLSRQRPGFMSGSVHVGFVVDKMAVERDRFLCEFFGFPHQYLSTLPLSTHVSPRR